MSRLPSGPLSALALLAGLALPAAANQAAPAGERVDRAHGYAIALPPDAVVRTDFAQGYLLDDSWKAFAEPRSRGTPLLALVLPGSNSLLTGELRIGASGIARERARCTALPAAATPASRAQTRLGGHDAVRFRAADGAMMHFVEAESYRVVRHGRCYAIDLLVSGTRPEAYDPPRQPPFSREQAFARLRAWLQGLRFLD
jgi:hypothetical protein